MSWNEEEITEIDCTSDEDIRSEQIQHFAKLVQTDNKNIFDAYKECNFEYSNRLNPNTVKTFNRFYDTGVDENTIKQELQAKKLNLYKDVCSDLEQIMADSAYDTEVSHIKSKQNVKSKLIHDPDKNTPQYISALIDYWIERTMEEGDAKNGITGIALKMKLLGFDKNPEPSLGYSKETAHNPDKGDEMSKDFHAAIELGNQSRDANETIQIAKNKDKDEEEEQQRLDHQAELRGYTSREVIEVESD
jgi:hypothetical protein